MAHLSKTQLESIAKAFAGSREELSEDFLKHLLEITNDCSFEEIFSYYQEERENADRESPFVYSEQA